MKFASCLLALSIAAAPQAAYAQQDGIDDLLAKLVGTWRTDVVSMQVSPTATAFVRRTATFEHDHERLLIEAFADQDMTTPLLTYDSEGPMKLIGPWDPIEGAFAAELQNERSEVTIFVDNDDLWEAVNLGDCSLEVGVAVDISECSKGPPFQVVDCTDLEVIFISQTGTLQLGGGGVNRCLERPTELSDLVFTRVN